MTLEEVIDGLLVKQKAFALRLELLMKAKMPPRLKIYRIKLLTREITALRLALTEAVMSTTDEEWFTRIRPILVQHLEEYKRPS